MAEGTAYGVMIDSEGMGKKARTQFDVAKFDSDPWVKKNMAWDSDGNLGGSTTIGAVLDNAIDSKLITLQVRTTPETPAFYKILQKVVNKETHDKEDVFDYFQLNVVFDGIRRSVTFKNPIVKSPRTFKEGSVNFIIFSLLTKEKPRRDGGQL